MRYHHWFQQNEIYSAVLLCLYVCFTGLTLSAQTVITLTQPLEASGDIAINQQGEIFIGDFGESYQVPLGTNIYRIFPGGQVNLFFMG